MHNRIKACYVLLFIFPAISAYGQNNTVTAGGNITTGAGSVSYSIGQPFLTV
jgi:hypothetical protein